MAAPHPVRTRYRIVPFAVLAALLVPILAAGAVRADGPPTPVPVVTQGLTDRFGGGAWVRVQAGEANFFVVYGIRDHPNAIAIFAEFKRYLGGVDFVDEQGNLIATRGVPIFTVFGQSFERLVEFRDVNEDGLLDFRRIDAVVLGGDIPVKAIQLRAAWRLEAPPAVEVAGNATYVNFTLSARELGYTVVWDEAGHLPRRGTLEDGVLEHLAFTFHLKVTVSDFEADVPWYRVTVAGRDERRPETVEYEGLRTVSGTSVAMGAKYDHAIDGWDFGLDPSRLALENHVTYGNFVPRPVTRLVHAAAAEIHNNDSFDVREGETLAEDPVRPRLEPVTKDFIYLDDTWYRVGRLSWASEVVVDGVTLEQGMTFEVHGGEPVVFEEHGNTFAGFRLRAAFIYPRGETIFHDPGIDAYARFFDLPSVANATPLTVLALQLAVVGLAMGPAILLRARGRRSA